MEWMRPVLARLEFRHRRRCASVCKELERMLEEPEMYAHDAVLTDSYADTVWVRRGHRAIRRLWLTARYEHNFQRIMTDISDTIEHLVITEMPYISDTNANLCFEFLDVIKVLSINCRGMNFKMPKACANLEAFALHSDRIPSTVFFPYQHANLRSLDLSDSGLRELPPSLTNLVALTYLDLTGTVSVSTGDAFPRTLHTLILRKTNLVYASHSLQHLTNLRSLDMSYNSLLVYDEPTFESLHALPNLVSLNVSHNGLDAECLEELALLPALKYLDVSCNRGIYHPPDATFQTLEHLVVCDAPSPTFFHRFPRLATLVIHKACRTYGCSDYMYSHPTTPPSPTHAPAPAAVALQTITGPRESMCTLAMYKVLEAYPHVSTVFT